jgi:PTH1 family peptidyl-tRNA hydrolase
MLLLVGLGNPGKGYEKNRHNIGFMAIDAIANRHGFSAPRQRFHGEIREGRIADQKTLLLKPSTFMNRSGIAVREAAHFFKLEPSSVIVFYDEIDLAPGKIKAKCGGGHAGHNGLRDIIAQIGPEFHRMRMGVGHPGDKELVSPHVLSDFAKNEQPWLTPLLDAVAESTPWLVKADPERFLSEVARLKEGDAKSPKQEL